MNSRSSSPGAGRLPTGRLIAFSALAMPIAAVQVPLNVYLPALLAQRFGMALSTLGLIFLLEKTWGVMADPLIGVLSDRTVTRFGRRRVWIIGGSLLFAVCAVFLFFPLAPMTPITLGVALFGFYLAWSMVLIPYSAWSAEISQDYDERTRVQAYQTVVKFFAQILLLFLPTVIDQVAPQAAGLKLAAMGGLLLVLLAIGLPVTLLSFREPSARSPGTTRSLGATLQVFLADTLLLRVLASDFALSLAQAIRAALFVFFVAAYMGLPRWTSGLFLAQFVFSLAAGPIWMTIGRRLGKSRATIVGELVQVAINLVLLLLRPGDLYALLALTAVQGLAQGSGNLLLQSMVADIADRDRLRSGEDRTALFFSGFSISAKAAMAGAIGIALPLVGWLGFDPKAAVNTPAALHGLLLVFALGPALAHLVSAALVWRFPLDAAAHAEIRRQLAERDAAAAV